MGCGSSSTVQITAMVTFGTSKIEHTFDDKRDLAALIKDIRGKFGSAASQGKVCRKRRKCFFVDFEHEPLADGILPPCVTVHRTQTPSFKL